MSNTLFCIRPSIFCQTEGSHCDTASKFVIKITIYRLTALLSYYAAKTSLFGKGNPDAHHHHLATGRNTAGHGHQMILHSKIDQIASIMNVQLAHQIEFVCLHCLDAEIESHRNLAGRSPLGE
mgnify:CR=1 FL=1